MTQDRYMSGLCVFYFAAGEESRVVQFGNEDWGDQYQGQIVLHYQENV